MEPNTNTINRKWKNDIALWCFIGCVFLFLIFNYQITTKQSSISALLGAFHPSNTCLDHQPSEPKPEQPSNSVTITHTTISSPAAAGANQFATSSNITAKPPSEPKPEEPSNRITINHTTTRATTTTTNTTVGANLYLTSSNITEKPPTESATTKRKCNIFEGRWVYDPKQSPSYDAKRCPFFDQSLSCQKNGRPDSEYLKWRWEATDCDIPLFDGRDMLERLRNKRMVLVGDSLNRNQWHSLACLLYSSISNPSRAEVYTRGSPMFLTAKDYNFSVEFYMNPFLVERKLPHKSGTRVLVLDKIASASKKWKGADIMVFNSWHWWTHSDAIKGWDVYQYKGRLIKEMPREVAFERAMKTWARWIENNVDPKKTTVMFRSNSVVHNGRQSCKNSTKPILDNESLESHFPKPLIKVFDRIINGMSRLEVKYLNITKLSQYRRDAHPSMYTSLQWKDGKKPSIDCSHWCLPGLPDTWNRMLYASLFFDT